MPAQLDSDYSRAVRFHFYFVYIYFPKYYSFLKNSKLIIVSLDEGPHWQLTPWETFFGLSHLFAVGKVSGVFLFGKSPSNKLEPCRLG